MHFKLFIFAIVLVLFSYSADVNGYNVLLSIEDCKKFLHAGLRAKGTYSIPSAVARANKTCETSTSFLGFLKNHFGKLCRDWCLKKNTGVEHPKNCELVCRDPTYDPRYVTVN